MPVGLLLFVLVTCVILALGLVICCVLGGFSVCVLFAFDCFVTDSVCCFAGLVGVYLVCVNVITCCLCFVVLSVFAGWGLLFLGLLCLWFGGWFTAGCL